MMGSALADTITGPTSFVQYSSVASYCVQSSYMHVNDWDFCILVVITKAPVSETNILHNA